MAQLDKDVTHYKFYELLCKYIDSSIEHPTTSSKHQKHDIKYVKQVAKKSKEELKYCRTKEHYWTPRMYFLYSAMMGNGADGLTQIIPLTFALSGFIFLMVRFLTIIFFLLPLMKVEIFLGQYTKLTNGQLYRMAPVSFGLIVMNFVINVTYIPILMTEIPLLLLGCFRFLIDNNYMKYCLEEEATSYCLDYKANGTFWNDNCKSAFLSHNCTKNGRVAYVAQYHFWHSFYDYDGTHGGNNYNTSAIVLVCILSWVVLLGIVLSGMRYMKAIFVGVVIGYAITIFVIAIMVIQSEGADEGLLQLFQTGRVPTFKEISMVMSLSTINLKLITPVGFMTYKAFIKDIKDDHQNRNNEQHADIWKQNDVTCFLIKFLHLLNSLFHVTLMAQMCGVIAKLYGVRAAQEVFIPRIGMYYSLIVEFLHYKNVSAVFIIIYYLFVWGLEICKLAITMHFQILNLIDFFPAVCRFQHYVRVAWGSLSFLLTVILTNRHIFWFLPTYNLANVYFIESIRLFFHSFIIFYVYGIKRLEDDILFATGKRIVKIWRILWPIYPVFFLVAFIMMAFVFLGTQENLMVEIDVCYNNKKLILMTGLTVIGIYLLGAICILNIRIIIGGGYSSLSKLMKPDFYWGPLSAEKRQKRKEFASRIKIQMQHNRIRVQRFRQGSIRQMHEEDIALGVVRGRVFLDSMFYSWKTKRDGQQES